MAKSNEALETKIEDLQVELVSRLKRIESKQDFTNGRLRKAESRLDVYENQYENCSARKATTSDNKQAKFQAYSLITILVLILLQIAQFVYTINAGG